jgi:hypothetical protein
LLADLDMRIANGRMTLLTNAMVRMDVVLFEESAEGPKRPITAARFSSSCTTRATRDADESLGRRRKATLLNASLQCAC